jgi:hypothetical protein
MAADYLDTLLPESWEDLDLPDRRERRVIFVDVIMMPGDEDVAGFGRRHLQEGVYTNDNPWRPAGNGRSLSRVRHKAPLTAGRVVFSTLNKHSCGLIP